MPSGTSLPARDDLAGTQLSCAPCRGNPATEIPMQVIQSRLSMRTAMIFFIPLILTTELHQVSHSLVQGFLARLGEATITLAAFSVAFAFNTTFSGIIGVAIQASMAFISDKRSFWRVTRFYLYIGLVPFLFLESVALTPIGDWLFGDLIGASEEVTRLAKPASAIMALWIFPNQVRNIASALCMMRRQTMPLSHSTIVRLVAQVLMLMVLPLWMPGALAGAASLVGGMAVEALYMYYASRQIYRDLPASGGEQVSYRKMWTYSWPLMITTATENGVTFVINFFLGRLAHPDVALAAFGVVNALTSLIVSPLRNLNQTAQALVQSREDLRVMLRFVNRLTLVYMVLVAALFYTPVREVILSGIMGLGEELSTYAKPGVQMMLFAAIVWGYSSMLRGLLSAMRRTGAIAGSAAIRLAVVIAVGSVTLIAPNLNGAMVGIGAIGAAFLAEALVLGWRVRQVMASGETLFPARIARTEKKATAH